MKPYLVGMSISIILVIVIVSLFFMSFAGGVMDGCKDAGYNTFAVGEEGIYCIDSHQFSPIKEHKWGEL